MQFFHVLRFGAPLLASAFLVRYCTAEALAQYERLMLLWATLSFAPQLALVQVFNTKAPNALSASVKEYQKLKSAAHYLSILLGVGIAIGLLGCVYVVSLSSTTSSLTWVQMTSIAIWGLGWGVSALLEYKWAVEGKLKKVVYSAIGVFVLQPLAVWIPLVFSLPEYTLYIFIGVVGLIRLVLVLCELRGLIWERSSIVSLLKGAMPFLGVALMGGGTLYVAAWLVEANVSDAAFIFYRYGAREIPFAALLGGALSLTYSGRLAQGGTLDANALQSLKQATARLATISFVLAGVMLAIASPLFRAYYGEAYILSAAVFMVYVLLTPCRLVFPQTVLIALGKSRVLLWVSVLEWLLHAGLCYWWVHQWGIMGAAWAYVASTYFEKTLLFLYCKHLGVSLSVFTPLRLLGLFTAVLFLGYWLFQYWGI